MHRFDTYTASSPLCVIRQGKEESLANAWSMIVSPPRDPRVRRKVLPGNHAHHRTHDIATVVLICFHLGGKLVNDILLPRPWSRVLTGFRSKRHLRRDDFCRRSRPRNACRSGHWHSLCLTRRVNRSWYRELRTVDHRGRVSLL